MNYETMGHHVGIDLGQMHRAYKPGRFALIFAPIILS